MVDDAPTCSYFEGADLCDLQQENEGSYVEAGTQHECKEVDTVSEPVSLASPDINLADIPQLKSPCNNIAVDELGDDQEQESVSSESGSDEEQADSDGDTDSTFWLYESSDGSVKSKITVMDHITSILGYSIRHNLSEKATNDLIKLLNIHLPFKNQHSQSIKTLKKKLVEWMHLETSVVEYCESCFATWSDIDKNQVACSTESCKGLRYKGEDQSKKILNTYFIKSNIRPQIQTILERSGMWVKISSLISQRMETSSSVLSDIIDGELCKSHPVLSKDSSSISLIWNTDGLALFKSSKIELWPVYVVINEIPAKERYLCKNLCLWGIWQGRGKPPTNAFLKPFLDDMKDLSLNGLQVKLSSEGFKVNKIIRACPIISSMDLIAKAQFLNMVQHNGYNGCSACLIKGEHVRIGKGFAHMYPYEDSKKAQERSPSSFYDDALAATKDSVTVNGIKGFSMLQAIPHFNIIYGVVPDYMHGVLLGVVRTLLFLWFETSEHRNFMQEYKSYPDYFIGHLIDEVDSRLMSMKPPYEISRRPRILKGNLHNSKANELRSWLLYYALPCLKNILPNNYWNHFGLLTEAMHILLGKSISLPNLQKAELCLDMFYRDFCLLYDHHKGKCGLNVHNLSHLVEYTRKCGPLWAWSCFAFEGFNGIIVNHVHGTKNVCHQVMDAFNTIRNIYTIADASITTSTNRMFLDNMLYKKKSSSWKKICNSQFAIPPNGVAPPKHLLDKCGMEKALQLSKAEVKNQIFYGKKHKEDRKSHNHLCLVDIKDTYHVFSIDTFIFSESMDLLVAIGDVIDRKNDWCTLESFETSHIMVVDPLPRRKNVIINCEDISEKLFSIDGNTDYQCIAKFPNIVEKD